MTFDELKVGDIFLAKERRTNKTWRCVKTRNEYTTKNTACEGEVKITNARAIMTGLEFCVEKDWPVTKVSK